MITINLIIYLLRHFFVFTTLWVLTLYTQVYHSLLVPPIKCTDNVRRHDAYPLPYTLHRCHFKLSVLLLLDPLPMRSCRRSTRRLMQVLGVGVHTDK
jgi:hypothetical protein